MSIETLVSSTLKAAKKNERHHNVAETRYWCDQYRMLAEWAVKLLERQAIAEAEKQEPLAKDQWWAKELEGFWGSADYQVTLDTRRAAKTALTVIFDHPQPAQPKREPLTDEQVEKIIKDNMSLQMNLAGIRQDFEAAYGIKGDA